MAVNRLGSAEPPVGPFLTLMLISQKVFTKTFCRSQFPHKFVDSFFVLVIIKDELTDLCGNELLQSDFVNTLCEITVHLALDNIHLPAACFTKMLYKIVPDLALKGLSRARSDLINCTCICFN